MEFVEWKGENIQMLPFNILGVAGGTPSTLGYGPIRRGRVSREEITGGGGPRRRFDLNPLVFP